MTHADTRPGASADDADLPELGRRARQSYERGRQSGSDRERLAAFNEGIAAARALLARAPDDPDGLLWLAANLGAEALLRGKLAALRAVPEIERLLLQLERIAPEHDHAAAARALGRLYHKAPPVISVGSNAKARRHYELALGRAGSFRGNQALAAEFFAETGDRPRAEALARLVLSGQPEAGAAADFDEREWREIAVRILKDRA